MMALSSQQRILLAVQPIDFRCGIDGLARLCRQVGRRQLFLPPATIVFAGLKPSSLVHHRAV